MRKAQSDASVFVSLPFRDPVRGLDAISKKKKRERERERKEENEGRKREKERERERKREKEREEEREKERREKERHPVCRFKTSPCVGSKRLRVHGQ